MTLTEIFANDGIALLVIAVVVGFLIFRVIQSICDDIWMSHYYNECDRRLEREFRD